MTTTSGTPTRDTALEAITGLAAAPELIDGALRAGDGDRELTVTDPSLDVVLARVRGASTAQLDEAAEAAGRAQRAWEDTAPAERARLLRALADAIEVRADEFVGVITAELGSPLTLSRRLHVDLAVRDIRAVADALEAFTFERRIGNSVVTERAAGVVLAITPWNYPLHQVVAKVAPAIAAGCTVILKPSENALATAALFARCVVDSGLPAGVLNVVLAGGREIVDHLVGHPGVDLVSFTGSTEVGSSIAARAARTITRVHLELGGKSPSLVAPSADLATAVKVTLANAFFNSGQSCNAWTRLLVPRASLAETEEQLVALAARHRPSDPWSDDARMGPVVSAQRQAAIWRDIAAVEDRGERILAGGLGLPDGTERGSFVRPTVVFDVDPHSPIAQEEVFGPVLTVLGYDDLDHAIELANGTRYGLGGSVWAASTDEAAGIAREVRSGQLDLNGGAFNPAAPFGGFKSSGYGRELGSYGIAGFLEPQSFQY
ncbi:aldehyde dehydrogenase family protein [Microbacterium capsulatum]|uniref:aldehyde dehydrogenase (NAD(+)) n=1 Tax=Microbacterium capsulatum TaxID=3041921 RepID=A0ABU0XIJ2_9MICO|nr:aldehyde dehydrogenase family protein [Microbacterium sp. ASV81]MDQ4214963.1 aldehyde dehydrogenase family protein [Microbacterium sp. ASV81]